MMKNDLLTEEGRRKAWADAYNAPEETRALEYAGLIGRYEATVFLLQCDLREAMRKAEAAELEAEDA